MSILFKSSSLTLSVDEKNGAVQNIISEGELLAGASEMFTLRMLEKSTGDFRTFSMKDFPRFSCTGNTLCYKGNQEFPDWEIGCRIRTDGESLRLKSFMRNVPDSLQIDLVEMPHICVPYENEILWPFGMGCFIRDPQKSKRPYHQYGFPYMNYCVYPGVGSVQFYASFGKKRNLYYAADDFGHNPKTIECGPREENFVRLRMECTFDGKTECPYELVLRGFSGDWMDACEIYREQIKNDPVLKRDFPLPEWLEDSPVVIIYPVRGDQHIKDIPNRFLPYESAFPRIQELAEALDSRIMVLLMRWDKNGPWMPPHYWPPVGGTESFCKYRDLLHKEGHLIALYGSGTSYTRKSLISDFSDEEEFQSKHLDRFMTRGPKGEIEGNVCASFRYGTELCISEDWSIKTMCEEIEAAAEHGVDFYQILDQNHGAQSFACYSKEHHHPSYPGKWQTEAMQKLIAKMRQTAHDAGRDTLIGCENVPAEPYLAQMPINDTRDPMMFGRPVPVIPYLFHHITNNFMGNESGAWNTIDCLACPDNLLFRMAMSFVRGELLSLVLRDSGEIDWGAAADWKKPAPEPAPFLKFAKELNFLRKKYRQYLLHGMMCKPHARIRCKEYELVLKCRENEIFPLLPDGTFRASDGTAAQFIVNPSKETQSFHAETNKPCTLVCGNEKRTFTADFEAEIPPLSAAVIFSEP